MSKPIDFTGFSPYFYINFLSAHGKIVVTTQPPHTREEEKIYGYSISSDFFKRNFFRLSGHVYG